jgi:N-glycosylase/DNA lyase
MSETPPILPFPEPWQQMYQERHAAILQRLHEFSQVPPSEYFYELAYCILTPQSSARNAGLTVEELRRDDFLRVGFDPTSYLRDPAHYIRFHNVKAKRLLDIRDIQKELTSLVSDESVGAYEKREKILTLVKGLGMKEASHFLRNIGVRGLAILDRHIFKHLADLEVIESVPPNAPTKKRYLEIERLWHGYSVQVGISLDELDLLFWSMQTGEILK